MPSMANITVLNASAANVIYVAAVPSAGDTSAARWNQNAASGIAGFRPTFTSITRDNGNNTGRRLTVNYMFPVVETVGGVDTITAKVTASSTILLPTNVAVSSVKNGYVQFANLLASPLMVAVAEEGYSPT